MAEEFPFKTKKPHLKSLKTRMAKPRKGKTKLPKLGKGMRVSTGLKIPGASE
jgi:hypothetical protein